jgi:carboxypeptidase family protein
MRRLWCVCLVLALISPGIPLWAFSPPQGGQAGQSPQQFGAINGTVRSANGQALANFRVRVRDSKSGAIVAGSTSNTGGGFSIAGVAPGTYVVEAVNAGGQVVGLSSSVAVASGAMSSTAIIATAAGTAAQAAGGFSLLGLGTAASVGVIAAAGAAGVAGIVVASHNASPSK